MGQECFYRLLIPFGLGCHYIESVRRLWMVAAQTAELLVLTFGEIAFLEELVADSGVPLAAPCTHNQLKGVFVHPQDLTDTRALLGRVLPQLWEY